MRTKRHNPEEIVTKLRQVDLLECLAMRVRRRLNPTDVLGVLTDWFIVRGVPAFIRSDNGPEFVAQAMRDWMQAACARIRRPNGTRVTYSLTCKLDQSIGAGQRSNLFQLCYRKIGVCFWSVKSKNSI